MRLEIRIQKKMQGEASNGPLLNPREWPVWIWERERRRVKENRVELTENRIILDKLYSILFSLNSNGPEVLS